MCVVSAVFDNTMTIPVERWTWPAFNDFQEIIKRLEELDRKLGQPDCTDPAKKKWLSEIEDRLSKVEKKVSEHLK